MHDTDRRLLETGLNLRQEIYVEFFESGLNGTKLIRDIWSLESGTKDMLYLEDTSNWN